MITPARRAMDTIQTCINILHDMAAESPQAAAEILAELHRIRTPVAFDISLLVREVAEARHGEYQVRSKERKL